MFKTRPRKRAPMHEQSSNRSDLSSELVNMFLTLQEKLNSPVFNGGFEKLLLKIEAIESSQKQTGELVSSINKTIYEPDEGLFSRIRKAETQNSSELQKIANVQDGMKSDIAEMKESLKTSTQVVSDIIDLKKKIEALEEWRKDKGKKLWILIPVIVSLIGKLLFDVISSHIVLK